VTVNDFLALYCSRHPRGTQRLALFVGPRRTRPAHSHLEASGTTDSTVQHITYTMLLWMARAPDFLLSVVRSFLGRTPLRPPRLGQQRRLGPKKLALLVLVLPAVLLLRLPASDRRRALLTPAARLFGLRRRNKAPPEIGTSQDSRVGPWAVGCFARLAPLASLTRVVLRSGSAVASVAGNLPQLRDHLHDDHGHARVR
jgi:hypothetical protein